MTKATHAKRLRGYLFLRKPWTPRAQPAGVVILQNPVRIVLPGRINADRLPFAKLGPGLYRITATLTSALTGALQRALTSRGTLRITVERWCPSVAVEIARVEHRGRTPAAKIADRALADALRRHALGAKWAATVARVRAQVNIMKALRSR